MKFRHQSLLFNSHISNFSFLVNVNPSCLSLNCTPSTIVLNSEVVFVHSNSEKSTFSPICSPTVSGNPIFNSVFFSPTNNGDLVVNQWSEFNLFENTSSISIKFFSGINTTRDRTSSINFSFHSVGT